MMNTTTPKRFLMIGCGGIAIHAHLPAFEKYPDRMTLSAICDPNPQATATVVKRMSGVGPLAVFHDHVQAIHKMVGQIDAILIATPHFLHAQQVEAAINAGIPVLVEKPLCNTMEEAESLLKLSREKDVMVVVGQNRRYEVPALWLKEWVKQDQHHFGELRSFNLHGWQNIESWIAGKSDRNADFWILDGDRAGGGVVISLMVHGIDMVRHISGLDFVEVLAKGRFDPPFKHGAESCCSAMLTLSNGAVGTLHANYLTRRCPRPLEQLKMIGEYGTIEMEDELWRLGSTLGKDIEAEDWSDSKMKQVEADVSEGLDAKSSIAQLLGFVQALETGKAPLNHIEANYNTIATVQAIMSSMQQGGSPVEVKSA